MTALTDLPLVLPTLRLPGRGGELQAAGATTALVAELGGDYATYHAFLAQTLDALGTEADPRAFADDFAGYCARCAAIEEVYRAESWLRAARAIVAGPSAPAPLTDAQGRLVSVQGAPPIGTGRAARPQVASPIP